MENKEIYIDGVDVSGCEFYSRCTDQCLDYRRWYNKPLCKHLPDCHYKQLKRSEAQCEVMFVSHTDLEKKYKAKEQECEELKEKVKKYGEINKQETKDYAELKAENKELKGIRDRNFLHALEEQKRADKLKQTLTEIKEIAEIRKNDINDWLAKEILQKISEVEDG